MRNLFASQSYKMTGARFLETLKFTTIRLSRPTANCVRYEHFVAYHGAQCALDAQYCISLAFVNLHSW